MGRQVSRLTGHDYIGHNYIGHNYIGWMGRQVSRPTEAVHNLYQIFASGSMTKCNSTTRIGALDRNVIGALDRSLIGALDRSLIGALDRSLIGVFRRRSAGAKQGSIMALMSSWNGQVLESGLAMAAADSIYPTYCKYS